MGRTERTDAEAESSVAEVVWDTSVWIALLRGDDVGRDAALAGGGARVVVTPVVAAEVLAMERRKRPRAEPKAARFLDRARREPVTFGDAATAADVYARIRRDPSSKASLVDCLVYSTARRIGAEYVTLDRDLRGEPGVHYVRA